MMNKLLYFIKNANQFLLFFGSILIIIVLTNVFIREVFPTKYERPKIEIIGTSENSNDLLEVEYKKEYVVYVKDVHIIKITSSSIRLSQKKKILADSTLNMFSSGYDENSIVNFMFVKNDNSNHMLFENDTLITTFNIANFEEKNNEFTQVLKLSKNFYSVVEEDSNDDGYLGDDDRKSLYVSEYDGTNIKLVLSNIITFRLIENELILIQQFENKTKQFYLYNVETSNMTKLNTEISLTKT